MNHVILFVILLFGIKAHSQKNEGKITIECNGLKELNVKAFVLLNDHTQGEFIPKNDLLRYDLQLGLTDTSFKIIGFVAGYDCHSGSILDFNERTYLGNFIKAGDPFIRNIWVRDQLVIECINVEKKGTRYLIKGLQFKIY